MQQKAVGIQRTDSSFAPLSPLPMIRVLYAIGVKGAIKVLCMQNEVILRPMDLNIYLEGCTAFAAGNQNHIPKFGSDFGSDGRLQNH